MKEERNRRLGHREPSLIRAQIVDKAGWATPVWVRDYSSTGVRLEIPRYADIPRRFILRNAFLDRKEIDVEVVWRRAAEMGVRFITEDKTERADTKRVSHTKMSLAELRLIARANRRR
jgi:hypothetical protein